MATTRYAKPRYSVHKTLNWRERLCMPSRRAWVSLILADSVDSVFSKDPVVLPWLLAGMRGMEELPSRAIGIPWRRLESSRWRLRGDVRSKVKVKVKVKLELQLQLPGCEVKLELRVGRAPRGWCNG